MWAIGLRAAKHELMCVCAWCILYLLYGKFIMGSTYTFFPPGPGGGARRAGARAGGPGCRAREEGDAPQCWETRDETPNSRTEHRTETRRQTLSRLGCSLEPALHLQHTRRLISSVSTDDASRESGAERATLRSGLAAENMA